MGWFEEEPVRQALGIPPEVRVVAVVSVGYPDEARPARKRRALEEILS